jgi:peptide/nickel transport system substrate-binding protein
MITRRTALGLLATTLMPAKLRAAGIEVDSLLPKIESGELPPIAARLPKTPRVINLAGMGRLPGQNGGSIRTIIGGPRDIRVMTIYGYARLIGYNEKLEFEPDILESYEVVEERIFAFRLREGHRWSDGTPLSVEDFRYCWEDIINNEDLTSGGVPINLRVNGKGPKFEIVDPLTVRYSWDAPNPDFLPSLASAQPQTLVLPAHYLKQFHGKYQSEDKLKELMKEHKAKKWTGLHIKMSRTYRPENPALPTLDPWRNTTESPAEQYVFERNPFFHRVDENGRQLPYIDRVVLNVSSSAIVPAKTGAGESDLQATGIDFADYTFLKDSEKRYPVKVSLWTKIQGARFAILPNLNYADEVWRGIIQDVRFRRALSIALDRREINLACFFGLGKESADTVLPTSPLYRPEYAQAWIGFDRKRANALLDEIGLDKRDDDGIRILPDGRSAQLIIETPGESTLETDVLELVADHWRQVGLAIFIRTSQRDIFRSRAIAGQIMLSLWSGMDNGVPTPDMSPDQLAPTAEDSLQWPIWGIHYMTGGDQGRPPDMPEVVELVELLRKWKASATVEERTQIWHRMLTIYTDQVFSIGIVNQTQQPILRSARLRNVPEEGLYGFDPTCYLGIYKPDTFWLEDS